MEGGAEPVAAKEDVEDTLVVGHRLGSRVPGSKREKGELNRSGSVLGTGGQERTTSKSSEKSRSRIQLFTGVLTLLPQKPRDN